MFGIKLGKLLNTKRSSGLRKKTSPETVKSCEVGRWRNPQG